MFDLKVINSVLGELEEERGISKEKMFEAIEMSLASAYKKEYGKKGQIINAKFDINSGSVEFSQSKIVVDKDMVIMEDELDEKSVAATDTDSTKTTDSKDDSEEVNEEDQKVRFNPEHHILIEDARLLKSNVEIGEELIFPLEKKDDFGRIAAQTAKQVITQKIREAEKVSVMAEFGEKEGEIVSGTVERMERGTIFLNMGRAVGELRYEEQIPGERFKQGERVRAYLFKVEEGMRGVFLRLSRSHPKFLEELFRAEVPELVQGIVEIKSIAREAGSRSKVAVATNDNHVDPVGSLVGQRGVRVSPVMSELGGEKIDIVEWSEDPISFIEESLSPARIQNVEIIDEENKNAKVIVDEDQLSLAIGKGGQNVRLAAKLTGWKIDIASSGVSESDSEESDNTVESTEAKVEEKKDSESEETAVEENKETSDSEDIVDTESKESSADNIESEDAEKTEEN